MWRWQEKNHSVSYTSKAEKSQLSQSGQARIQQKTAGQFYVRICARFTTKRHGRRRPDLEVWRARRESGRTAGQTGVSRPETVGGQGDQAEKVRQVVSEKLRDPIQRRDHFGRMEKLFATRWKKQ